MENRPWKERVIAKKREALKARGEKYARDEKENKQFLKESEERGGIVAPKVDN